MKIGFVGLGKMGIGMARNLVRAGHELTVYNRTREKAEALAGDRVRVAATPAEASREVEAVFTMLSDDQAVNDVVFGPDGIASALKPGAAHLSSSTISARFSRRLAQEHGNRQQVFVSACVFGRPEAAEAKKLVVACAGEQSALEKYRPLFDAVGRQTFVVASEPWQANVVKVCVNFTIASLLELFGETFATMRKAGIDHHRFLEILNELYQSPVYKTYGGIVADEKFEPAGFALKLGLKDVRLAVEAAQDLNVPMPFASVLRDQFLSAVANGQGDMDWASVAKVAARNAGLARTLEPISH